MPTKIKCDDYPPRQMDVYIDGHLSHRDIDYILVQDCTAANAPGQPYPHLNPGERVFITIGGKVHIVRSGRH